MTQFRSSEYEGRFWTVNSSEQWQMHPNANLKLLIAPSGNQEESSTLADQYKDVFKGLSLVS